MLNTAKKESGLVKKAARLAQQLNEVLKELASITENGQDPAPPDTKATFDPNELRADFEKLRLAVENGVDAQIVVANFLEATSKERLRAFIRANGLPIVAKNSKASVSSQLVQLLRQSKAIGAPVNSLAKSANNS